MAAYRMKVTYKADGKLYAPGSILPSDMSSSDLAFLKSKKFVELVDVPPAITEAMKDEDEPEENDNSDIFDEMSPPEYKSNEEIMKLRSKEAVAEYAASIGCEVGEDYKEKALSDLYNIVINYQEEMLNN